jgi:xanthine dehydrogenase YagS FAD-binding subunit
MRAFDYASARTLDEAVGLLSGKTRALAGGTDLLTLMKADIAAPERLVDIKRAAGLSSRIEETGEGLVLGALATLSDIARHPGIAERYAVLGQAAEAAATPQLRNMATLAGNLLQRPRCWYYRNAHIDCWLKGGGDCPAREGENRQHALFGDSPCVAAHPSDPACALLALDTDVLVQGKAARRILLSELFSVPQEARRTETTLAQDELIVSLRVAPHPEGTRSTYLKAMDRKFWAFALASVAAVARFSGSRIAHARVVLGGVAPIPWRSQAAETVLIGRSADDALFEKAADAALEDARALQHNGYKIPLARALVRRALRHLAKDET